MGCESFFLWALHIHDRNVSCASLKRETIEAGIQVGNGRYSIIVRFGGSPFARFLRKTVEGKATARKHRVEENIRLIDGGRLDKPDNAGF